MIASANYETASVIGKFYEEVVAVGRPVGVNNHGIKSVKGDAF